MQKFIAFYNSDGVNVECKFQFTTIYQRLLKYAMIYFSICVNPLYTRWIAFKCCPAIYQAPSLVLQKIHISKPLVSLLIRRKHFEFAEIALLFARRTVKLLVAEFPFRFM